VIENYLLLQQSAYYEFSIIESAFFLIFQENASNFYQFIIEALMC